MPDEILSGDTGAADAGQQMSDEELLGLDQTGETDAADAGQETQETDEGASDEQFDEKQELAFKKRLEREQAKLEEKIRQELQAEYEAKYGAQAAASTSHTGATGYDANVVNDLADRLGVTPELAQVMLAHQLELQQMKDESSKAQARSEIEALRAERDFLPAWNEKRLSEIRSDYERRTGARLPWKDAYQVYVAEQAIGGQLSVAVEQKAMQNITGRATKQVQAGRSQSAKKPDIWDMSPEEFERLKQRALAGELRKS